MSPASLPEKIRRNSAVDEDSGCWLWRLTLYSGGYGRVRHGKLLQAHRASYQAFRGPIPDGMLVCHKCDVRHCVNPDHLFLGTHTDNMIDMRDKRRHSHGFKAGRAILSEWDIPKIRALRKAGLQHKEIAAQFGVSRMTINGVLNGYTWNHVKEDKMKVCELVLHVTPERKYSYALDVADVIHVGFDFETVHGALTAAHEHIAAAERKRLGKDAGD